MKTALRIVTIICFSAGMLLGCSLHTLIDINQKYQVLQVKYIGMSIKQLGEVRI